MPGYDGTGPNGQGPMTGRGLGPCGRGLAVRHGFGRGFAFRQQAVIQPQVITEDQKKEILQKDLEALKQEIKAVQDRLKELK